MQEKLRILTSQQSAVSAAEHWKKEVMERVGFFLDPITLSSVLIIQPGASGDVALSTPLFAYIKSLNPGCCITVMTRRSTASVARLCPHVDLVEMLPEDSLHLGRRALITKFAYHSDSVLYVWYFSEDSDLGLHYNLFETIWLLSGLLIPQGLSRSIALQDRSHAHELNQILRQSIGLPADFSLTKDALSKLYKCLRDAFRNKQIRQVGLRAAMTGVYSTANQSVKNLLVVISAFLNSRKRYIILSMDVFSLSQPPPGLQKLLVKKLTQDGWIVLNNVRVSSEALDGTIALVCSYEEFIRIRCAGVPLIAWRSGLCDIAAASATVPIVAFYPEYSEPHPRLTMEHFSFKSMGINANALELVCNSTDKVEWDRIAKYLG